MNLYEIAGRDVHMYVHVCLSEACFDNFCYISTGFAVEGYHNMQWDRFSTMGCLRLHMHIEGIAHVISTFHKGGNS